MSNIITSQNIRLRTNYKIVEIEDIQIASEINQHTKLYIKGIIEYDEEFLYNTTVDDILQVYVEGEEPTILFTGIPSNIQVRYEKEVCYIEIFCESGTSLMDDEERSHSFQNKNMKYKELATKVNGNYNGADTICTLDKEATIGEIQIQYKETDWEFLKRIATHEQSFLVADFESEFPKYWLGIPEQQNPKVKELKDTKESILREVLETKYEVSKYEYEVLLFENYKIGDKIKINNDTLTITKCVVKLKDGILQFNYKIENLNYLKTKLLENRKVQGVSLVGTILDVALNQVKIHLDIDESQDKATAHWFPYSAEANNVWYTMPHIGEKIRIYFPTMREAEAITMSSTRGSSGEIATNKTMNKPTEKYLDTKWGKQVALKESNVNVNTPLMSMILDEENITLDSNQNIEITANEVLNVGRSEFTYTDLNGVVQTKIEETQSITIETEELCTVSVTSTGTVIELDEDNFIMPQDKVKMEGTVKDGFANMGSPGQDGGAQAEAEKEQAELEKTAEEEKAKADAEARQAELDARKEKGEGKKKQGKFFKALGAAIACVAVVTLAVVAAPLAVTAMIVGAAVVGVGLVWAGGGLIREGEAEIALAEAGITEAEQQVETDILTKIGTNTIILGLVIVSAGSFVYSAPAAMSASTWWGAGLPMLPSYFTLNAANDIRENGPERIDEGVSTALSVAPVIGDIKDGTEAVTGIDSITGEELTNTQRALSGLSALPLISGLRNFDNVKGANGIISNSDEALEGASASIKNGENALDGASAGVKNGDDILSRLSRAQKRNIEKLNNIITNNLKEHDFSGTLRDLQGNPVPNPKGGYWDHLTEMKQSYTGLKDVQNGLEGSLKNPNLDPDIRKFIEEELAKTNYYLKKIEELFEPFGGIN